MGRFFGQKKKIQQESLKQPLHDIDEQVAIAPPAPAPVQQQQQSQSRILPSSSSRSNKVKKQGEKEELDLDWSKIYVEIDNDANNRTVVPDQSVETETSYDDTATAQPTMGSFETGMTGFSHVHSRVVPSGTSEEISDDDDDDLDGNETQMAPSQSFSRAPIDGTEEQEDGSDEDAATEFHRAPSYQPSVRTVLTNESAANFTITNNGQYLTTNDFANAQLFRWKFAAEEGPAYIQILALLAALAALTSTLYPIVTNESYWTVPTGICAFHTTVLCVIILVFESRALGARNPMNGRARARTLLTRYLNILRLLWGRGCLYIFAGSMNIAIFYLPWVLYTGFTLIGLGVLAMLVGSHASFNLERLKLSLTDHSYLWNKFDAADSDRDNLIDISEFSNLIWSLGMELDDAYTYRAFAQIDNDSDARINFREFKRWWISAHDDDKIVPPKKIDV
jgi:hypothetical protein